MSVSFWADIALVWLLLFCFIGLSVPLVVAYLAIRGLHIAHTKAQSLIHITQGYSRQVRDRSTTLSERVREPVVRARMQEAKLARMLRTLWPGHQRSSKEHNRGS